MAASNWYTVDINSLRPKKSILVKNYIYHFYTDKNADLFWWKLVDSG